MPGIARLALRAAPPVFPTWKPHRQLLSPAGRSHAPWQTDCSSACMTRSLRAVLFLSLVVAGPAIARAQDPTPSPPQEPKEEARQTGLPSRISWTFNFDAGWGTFGFANSLFNNPKEPGVDENLSDQWFEGYVKPALSATYTTGLGKRDLRQAERRRRTNVRIRAGCIRPGRVVLRPRGPLHRLAIRQGVDDRRERPGLHDRAVSIPARSRVPPLRRRRRRRQPRRLLDQRAERRSSSPRSGV